MAQFGNNVNRFGRQRSIVPQQQQTAPPEPEPMTAEQVVDAEMPKIKENLNLDPFEEAVVRSILVNSVQKRMELQILQLEPQKMREEFQKIKEKQDEELKAGLPAEKYEAYLDLQSGKSKGKGKRKKKKKKEKSKT